MPFFHRSYNEEAIVPQRSYSPMYVCTHVALPFNRVFEIDDQRNTVKLGYNKGSTEWQKVVNSMQEVTLLCLFHSMLLTSARDDCLKKFSRF